MGCIWNIVRANLQEGARNSDDTPPVDSLCSEKFSGPDSGENFIRADLSYLEPGALLESLNAYLNVRT
jgi:hypothetical protein